MINNVIKKNNLSGPVGRPRTREIIVKKETEKEIEKKPVPPLPGNYLLENGGFFLLKAADLRLGLTFHLADGISGRIPEITSQIIETLIYSPHYKDKKSLAFLVEEEVAEETSKRFSERLAGIPLGELRSLAKEIDINTNFNDINELWENSISRLSSFLSHYFPGEFQFMEFDAMFQRFFSLAAKLESKPELLTIQLFHPKDFPWINDAVWYEGFSHASQSLNEARIFTPKKQLIRINPKVEIL